MIVLAGGGAVSRLHHRLRSSAGMVTVEIAMATLAVMPIVLALFVMAFIGAEQVRIVESARTAARMVARGQSQEEAQGLVQRTVPATEVDFETRGDDLVVTVARRIDPIGLFPALTLHATAVTPAETPSA